jgi:hypothetical protein
VFFSGLLLFGQRCIPVSLYPLVIILTFFFFTNKNFAARISTVDVCIRISLMCLSRAARWTSLEQPIGKSTHCTSTDALLPTDSMKRIGYSIRQ